MPDNLIIRPAVAADAEAMGLLRAASIRHLCSADHQDDPAAIDDWIGAPDKFVHLLARSDTGLIVAEIDGEMAGLAGLSGDLVTLNYVHPAFRHRGVSKALMRHLETSLVRQGKSRGRLNSTATALRFYQAIGWVQTGPGEPGSGYPMEKRL